jgi:hypothetical protein
MAQQWSKGRRNQLHKITRRLLKEKPTPVMVDVITIIHAYERLVTEQPDQPSYLVKMSQTMHRLATLLGTAGKTGQASRLKSLAPFRSESTVEVRKSHTNPGNHLPE